MWSTVFYCGCSCPMLHSHCVMGGVNALGLVELAFLIGEFLASKYSYS